MPPKRSASNTDAKIESPNRRKAGRPKRVEAEPVIDEPVEEPEEAEPSVSPKKKGRGRKAKSAAAAAVTAEANTIVEDDDLANVVTLNIEDLIGLPDEETLAPSKKRKAPAKSSATKKSKSDTGMLREFGAGDGENLIQCTLCDAKVVQLVRHIRAQHGDDPDYDSKIKEARSLEARVQSSNTPKKSASSLLDDLTIAVNKMEKATPIVDRRTTGERGNSLVRPKNTQCPICEKVVRRYDLNKHIRNVHSGEKPNKCPYCEYASPWKGNLNTHIAGVHTKARLHDCIRCGLSFKTRSAMIGHVRKVHDKMYQPKERLFECEECNKKFYKKFHLQRHIRVHTGEKPFTCAFCEKMFASKTNMDSHIQSVHLKIKPFKCGYCEKGFARKKMMLIHIRKFHMSKGDNSLALSGLDDVDDITLDDNLDTMSNASVESGEILAGGDGELNSGMVLVKMRGDGGDGTVERGVKQYLFVPEDVLPSDMDNTLDTTAGVNQSMDISQSTSLEEPEAEEAPPTVVADVAAAPAAEPVVTKKAPAASQPVVINVAAGQVVQALQTDGGIMLVTQSATITEHSEEAPAAEAATKEAEPAPVTEETAAASTEEVVPSATEPIKLEDEKEKATEKEEDAVEGEVVEETTVDTVQEEPDLIQQALEETVPEVSTNAASSETVPEVPSPTKTAAILSTQTDLIGGLPANLLATEEGDQNDVTGGDGKTVETFFLADIQTNGNN